MQKKLLDVAKNLNLKPVGSRSILAPYFDQILELRSQKYSYRQIASLLANIGIKTKWQNIQDYCNRHQKTKELKSEKNEIRPSFSTKDGVDIEKFQKNDTKKIDKARKEVDVDAFFSKKNMEIKGE